MVLLLLPKQAGASLFTLTNAIFHRDTPSSLIETRLRTNSRTVLVYHPVLRQMIGTLMIPTEVPSDRVVTLVVRQMTDCPTLVMTIPTQLSVTATCTPGASLSSAVVPSESPATSAAATNHPMASTFPNPTPETMSSTPIGVSSSSVFNPSIFTPDLTIISSDSPVTSAAFTNPRVTSTLPIPASQTLSFEMSTPVVVSTFSVFTSTTSSKSSSLPAITSISSDSLLRSMSLLRPANG